MHTIEDPSIVHLEQKASATELPAAAHRLLVAEAAVEAPRSKGTDDYKYAAVSIFFSTSEYDKITKED